MPSLEGARAFLQDPSLAAAMERAGVDGSPQIWIVEEAEAKLYLSLAHRRMPR